MITSNSTPRLPRRDNDVTRVKHLAGGQVVPNRSAVTALAALALLNVFTLGAGVAVAGLLPDRLALWQVPRVARADVAAPGAVLSPAGSHGPLPSRKRLAAVLAPLIGARPLGRHVGAVVTDLATGEGLFSRQAGAPFVPASHPHPLTPAAALRPAGPSAPCPP